MVEPDVAVIEVEGDMAATRGDVVGYDDRLGDGSAGASSIAISPGLTLSITDMEMVGLGDSPNRLDRHTMSFVG